MGREWKFYGREAEIEDLRIRLQLDSERREPPVFRAFGIAGRRGVGKNELLEETVRRHGSQQNLLVVEMPDKTEDVDCLTRLQRTIHAARLSHLLHDMKPLRPEDARPDQCIDVIQHLLYKGLIICLDEFQNVRNTGLPGSLKMMIDGLRSWDGRTLRRTGGPAPTGRLVCMGSHQQEFLAMFADSEPLHQRMHVEIHLDPWPLITVMDIARDQGWDRHPGRLLTLWTAFGGMPRNWERFVDPNKTPAILNDWSVPSRNGRTERQWRTAFIAHEVAFLKTDPRQRWDNQAIIELPTTVRDALLWLGRDRQSRRLAPVTAIARGLNHAIAPAKLQARLETLESHTRLVTQRGWLTGRTGGRPLWAITDNTALFQIRCCAPLHPGSPSAATTPDAHLQAAVGALQTLEGEMTENWCAAWLNHYPRVSWSATRLRGPAPKNRPTPDLDVMARIGPGGPNDLLVIGTAKRNARDHDPDTFDSAIACFMATPPEQDTTIDNIRNLAQCRICVSPEFPEAERSRLEAAGLLCFDIPAMQAEMNANWSHLNAQLTAAQPVVPSVPDERGTESEPSRPTS